MATIKVSEQTKKHWQDFLASLKKKDWEGCLAALNEVKDVEPENPNVYIKQGDVLLQTGRTTDAIYSYHQAAWFLAHAGEPKKALPIYKIILHLDPNNDEAMTQCSDLLMEIEAEDLRAEGKMAPRSTVFDEPLEEAKETGYGGYSEEGDMGMYPEQMAALGHEETHQSLPPLELPGEAEFLKSELNTQQVKSVEASSAKDSGGDMPWENLYASVMEGGEADFIPSIFATLDKEEALAVLTNSKHLSFNPGQAVIKEGEKGDSLYIIRKGSAKVAATIMGKTIGLAVLKAGDIFGEVAYLTGRPRTASVIAAEPMEVIELERKTIEAIINESPEVLHGLKEFYQSRVKDTLKKVRAVPPKPPEKK